jgi:hypothetical protein
MSNTHLLLRTLLTCTNMSWSCSVCSVCVCVFWGGGDACVFAYLLVCLSVCFFHCGMAHEEKTTVLLRIGMWVCPWMVTQPEISQRRNQRRGNVVYRTQNRVEWGVFRCLWLKSNTSFESSNMYWKKNTATGLNYIYKCNIWKKCSHTLHVSKSQHRSTAGGGLQTFMYITVQLLLM